MGIRKLFRVTFVTLLVTNLVTCSSLWAKSIIVLSDLDDTLKITQVQSSGRAVWNGIFTRKVFAGIPELWDNLQKYSDKSYVLTSSPNQIRFNILKLFQKFHMDVDELITRSLFRQRDSYRYKYEAIEKIILKNPNSELILLGDNTDKDHEVYQQIQLAYPKNVNAIYMHKVKDFPIPAGQISWISVLDIAIHEFSQQRMTFSEVVSIYETLIDTEVHKIIPNKLFCPKNLNDWKKRNDPELQQMQKQLAVKILNYCRFGSKG